MDIGRFDLVLAKAKMVKQVKIKIIQLRVGQAKLGFAEINTKGELSVHGTVGVFGIFAVLFSDPDATFMGQLVGMLVIFAWVFVTSLLVWLALKAIMGVRVSEEEEESGVDIAECGMEAYPEFVSQ